ncbi:GerMN domain-containing protein [Kocuria rhizophila]|nr:GerMN domain-containing protein [Kocuria rhizophila]
MQSGNGRPARAPGLASTRFHWVGCGAWPVHRTVAHTASRGTALLQVLPAPLRLPTTEPAGAGAAAHGGGTRNHCTRLEHEGEGARMSTADRAPRGTLHRALTRATTVALAGSLAVGLCSCGNAADRPDNNSAAAPGIGSAPLATDNSVDGVATEQAPVYWVGTGDQAGYLFREFRTPETTDVADPVARAAITVTASSPSDPDYRTLWTAVDSVGTSVSPSGTVTVDLPAAAVAAQLSEEDARMALQQMVYTVSAAAVTAGLLDASTAKEVRILVDGRTGYRAFGSVDLNDPLTRDPAVAAPIWLVDPQTGADPGSPVTVFARVLPSVHDVRWEIVSGERRVKGDSVKAASPGTDPTVGTELRTTVDLAPGKYTFRVVGTDDHGTTLTDDHEVTVSSGR